MSVIIPAAIVFPPERSINLPSSLLSAYVSMQTGDSVVISTYNGVLLLIIKKFGHLCCLGGFIIQMQLSKFTIFVCLTCALEFFARIRGFRLRISPVPFDTCAINFLRTAASVTPP